MGVFRVHAKEAGADERIKGAEHGEVEGEKRKPAILAVSVGLASEKALSCFHAARRWA
jgi:hypothetical protein